MKEIQFNKYIRRIGIEFEGFYNQEFTNRLLENSLIRDNTSDASLRSDFSGDYDPMEWHTNPLTAKGLTEILAVYDKAFKDRSYRLNSTVGLHYHISFTNNYYGYLVNPEFYVAYKNMLSEHFPTVYRNRRGNRYCYANMENNDEYNREVDPSHFRLQSPSKYVFINYQYHSFKTIEFRAYGGKYATIEGFSDCISKTIDLIGSFIENYKGKEVRKSVLLDPVNSRNHDKFINVVKNHQTRIVDTERQMAINYFLFSNESKNLLKVYCDEFLRGNPILNRDNFAQVRIEVMKQLYKKLFSFIRLVATTEISQYNLKLASVYEFVFNNNGYMNHQGVLIHYNQTFTNRATYAPSDSPLTINNVQSAYEELCQPTVTYSTSVVPERRPSNTRIINTEGEV